MIMSSPWQLLLVSLVSVLSGVGAEEASLSSAGEITEWELASLMHLQLTAPETEALELTYSVYPLTEHAGLNQSDRSSIWIRGSLVPAEVLPDADLKTEESIVFFSCDGENATEMVNRVMADRPKAILLYSLDRSACKLGGQDLSYNTFYTMGDSDAARETMNNTLRAGGILRATITGSDNMTSPVPGGEEGGGGRNSAVAMSVLYSITGLITLLFLVIIGTGAVRAHRYPERYGPRSGLGGRPSQSRAKGLARAVLETLPIVKFGDPSPAKADPSLELESQLPATTPDPSMGTRLSAIPEEPPTPQTRRSAAPMSGAVPETDEAPARDQARISGLGEAENNKEGTKNDGPPAEEHLGCSICTEDFTVGEDVRVLPCDHKFHPPCIDPWLINISGTCPLCRLDLHPHSRRSSKDHGPENRSSSDNNYHPSRSVSPSDATGTNNTTHQNRRSSRFLDLHRLRHASVEERIEILRRHRSHQQLRESATDGLRAEEQEDQQQQQQHARRASQLLLGRLHIRGRGHSPPRSPSSSPPPPTTANT
ncbi:hypothetical protein VTI28DRAFT_5930 [Corynascus sepedonium]